LLLPIASLQPCLAVGLNNFIDPFLASKREYRGEALQGELGCEESAMPREAWSSFHPGNMGFLNDVVLQDIAAYEQTQETLAMLKILALGNRQVEAGKVEPAAQVLKRLRQERKGS